MFVNKMHMSVAVCRPPGYLDFHVVAGILAVSVQRVKRRLKNHC